MKPLVDFKLRALFSVYPPRETVNIAESRGSTNDQPDTNWYYGQFITYIVLGILLVLANTPIFVKIIRHSALRAKKEYLLFAGLACSEMLSGWVTLNAGAYRVHLIEKNEANDQVSWWHCLGTPMFIVLIYSMIVQTGMLLIVSVDRLIAVTSPLKYVTLTRRYSICMIASCYLLGAIYTAFLIAYAYIVSERQPTGHALCIVGEVNELFDTVFYVRVSLSTLSVLVYAVVWYLFRRYQKITVTAFPSITTELRRAQRRLTTTMGICALFTLLLYIFPTMMMYTELTPAVWSPIDWHFICINGILNVFVYSLRQEDIRQGLKMLLLCKELPPQTPHLQTSKSDSFCVTAKAAMIVMEQMGAVVSNPMFKEMRSVSNAS